MVARACTCPDLAPLRRRRDILAASDTGLLQQHRPIALGPGFQAFGDDPGSDIQDTPFGLLQAMAADATGMRRQTGLHGAEHRDIALGLIDPG